MKPGKYLWSTAQIALRVASRMGARRLPLKWRKPLGSVVAKSLRMVTPVDTCEPHEIFGHRMFLHSKSENLQAMVFETYEEDTVGLFRKICRPGMGVVDVGANIGLYTLLAAEQVGSEGIVYAFEPEPEVYTVLLENIRLNGYQNIVKACPMAASNVRGSVNLFRGTKDIGESSFYIDRRVSPEDSLLVETIKLDEFFGTESWPSVDIIKMDIEGAESLALAGMKELVRRNPELKLIIEFSPVNQTKAGLPAVELLESLLSLGFRRFWAIKGTLHPIRIPEDIRRLIRLSGVSSINLLCELHAHA